jgi:hypothetical protein
MTQIRTDWEQDRLENDRMKRLHEDLLLSWRDCFHADPYGDGLRGCPRCVSLRHVAECLVISGRLAAAKEGV